MLLLVSSFGFAKLLSTLRYDFVLLNILYRMYLVCNAVLLI